MQHSSVIQHSLHVMTHQEFQQNYDSWMLMTVLVSHVDNQPEITANHVLSYSVNLLQCIIIT